LIRLVPIEKFYRIVLMPKVGRLAKWYLNKIGHLDQFDDACAYVFLDMLPLMRKFDPRQMESSSHFDKWLNKCIFQRIYTFQIKLRKGNWSKKDKTEIFPTVSYEDLDDLESVEWKEGIPDFLYDRRYRRFEDQDYHFYLWNRLLPSLIGHYRTRLLYYFYVNQMTYLKIAEMFGKKNRRWAEILNRESVTMLKMMADEDPKVREEFLR